MTTFQIADTTIVDLVLQFAENIVRGEIHSTHESVYLDFEHKGYTKQQIENAMTYILTKLEPIERNNPVRVFLKDELTNFEPAAAALLVKMSQLGILDFDQTELIIMRAAIGRDDKVKLSDLKIMVAMIFNNNSADIPKGVFIPDFTDVVH